MPWLKYLRERVLEATVSMYPGLEEDQIKLYVHCELFWGFTLCSIGYWRVSFLLTLNIADQPTYYHFHIHVVNVMLEAGATQATGKAFGLESLISQLETLSGDGDPSLADVDLTYFMGEASELWTDIFQPLKQGKLPSR